MSELLNPSSQGQGPAEGGRRERRKAETRRRLLAAARRLFVSRGFDATRPQDIAREADVAAGTFYIHFSDKRDAFLAVTEEAAVELMECVRTRGRGLEGASFDARLYASLEALCEYSDANPGVLRATFADESVIASGADRGARLRDRLAHNLAQGLRHGMLRGELLRDYDPLLVAYSIVGLVQGALGYGAQGGLDRRALLENVTRFCSRALACESASTTEPSAEEDLR